MNDDIKLAPGKSFPLGATVSPEGVNFSLFSKSSTGMKLLLFDHFEAPEPAHIIQLDPRLNRTFHYWHVFVTGLKSGQVYAYRADGPFEPGEGMRFDKHKLLLDPYGRCVAVPESYDRNSAALPGDNTAVAMRSVVVDLSAYDWEGDTALKRPFPQTVIYEMHVGGFTRCLLYTSDAADECVNV